MRGVRTDEPVSLAQEKGSNVTFQIRRSPVKSIAGEMLQRSQKLLGYRGFKNSPVRERFRLQFRGQFYNAFNRFSSFDETERFDNAGARINGQFGQTTAARDPRLIQLSMRAQS